MSYESLIKKVRQAEQALEARERSASASWRVAKTTWRESWTPGRITVIGGVAGFMFGRSKSKAVRKESQGVGLVRLVTSVIGLMGALQTRNAADEAEDAAEAAGNAAAGTQAASAATVRMSDRRAADPAFDSAPRPAEAATEVSESWSQHL